MKCKAKTFQFMLMCDGVPIILKLRAFIDGDRAVGIRRARFFESVDDKPGQQLRMFDVGTIELNEHGQPVETDDPGDDGYNPLVDPLAPGKP